jgi:hypothetical protein
MPAAMIIMTRPSFKEYQPSTKVIPDSNDLLRDTILGVSSHYGLAAVRGIRHCSGGSRSPD